jgi:diguanylate cyclase (GGDEF)-like protein
MLTPNIEEKRLLAVRSLGALTEVASDEMDALVQLARSFFDTQFAAINIIDEDWQRTAAQAGIRIGECSRQQSICKRVVAEEQTIILPDLRRDSEHSRSAYVVDNPAFRFYAGAPVRLEDRSIVGSLCILDTRPRNLDDEEIATLERLALVAGALLQLHRSNLILAATQSDLRLAAITDPLTGFFNRLALEEEIADPFAGREDLNGALFMDMDGFKQINDRFGHDVGDEVLRQSADRIGSIIGADDRVVRIGGDEFVLFIANIAEQDDLQARAERLVERFREPFIVGPHRIDARLSVGAACSPRALHTRTRLVKMADEALYLAKAAGRDCFKMAETCS